MARQARPSTSTSWSAAVSPRGRGRHVAHLHGVVAALGPELEGGVDDAPSPVALLGRQDRCRGCHGRRV
jgi:hypothetical protein